MLGVYWPFRAEFDPRPLVDCAVAAGREVALPVVIDKKGPLEYRAWAPGEALVDGVWDIPVPEKRDIVTPGDGAGAARRVRPRVLSARLWRRLFRPHAGARWTRARWRSAIGFALQEIETIYPQPFDMPMDLIVTEAGSPQPALSVFSLGVVARAAAAALRRR